MIEAALRLREAIWGVPLIILVVGAGVYLTVLLRALQFRGLPAALRIVARERDEPDADGDISHIQALMITLGSSVAGGNVAGVAVALVAGGPGALFWLWVAAFLAMLVRYSEALLGVRFRETDERGLKSGGPMYYLENGIRWGRLGRILALGFAAMAVLVSLGFGNGVQANAVAAVVSGTGRAHPLVVGGLTALLAGAAILGGVRSIARVVGVLVPVTLVVYVVTAVWVLGTQASTLPDVLRSVLASAFDGRAAGGGVVGYTAGEALRAGFRGSFAGDSAGGTGAIASAAVRTREPVRQALVAMLGPFIVALFVSTLTGLILLSSGVGTGVGAGTAGLELTRQAFAAALPRGIGSTVVAVAMGAFAFSALLAWAYYGERCARYLAGERAVIPFRLVYVGIIPLGAVLPLDSLWTLADALRGLMAVPNLVGLVLLSGIVVRETRAYFGRGTETGSQPSNRR